MSSRQSSRRETKEDSPPPKGEIIIVEKVKNPKDGQEIVRKYKKGRFLGKGGFANCYQVTNLQDGRDYAIKVVDKNTIMRDRAK